MTEEKESDIDFFSHDIELADVKMNKKEDIKVQFQKIENFLNFKVGTIWRVNPKTKKIMYIGKNLNTKFKFTVDLLNKTKHSFRNSEYFLVVPEQKCSKIGGNLGIIELI